MEILSVTIATEKMLRAGPSCSPTYTLNSSDTYSIPLHRPITSDMSCTTIPYFSRFPHTQFLYQHHRICFLTAALSLSSVTLQLPLLHFHASNMHVTRTRYLPTFFFLQSSSLTTLLPTSTLNTFLSPPLFFQRFILIFKNC